VTEQAFARMGANIASVCWPMGVSGDQLDSLARATYEEDDLKHRHEVVQTINRCFKKRTI
jgi:hypothetical protein